MGSGRIQGGKQIPNMQISPSIARRNLFIPPARRNLFIPPARRNLFIPPTRRINMKTSALTLTRFRLLQILGGFMADSGWNTARNMQISPSIARWNLFIPLIYPKIPHIITFMQIQGGI